MGRGHGPHTTAHATHAAAAHATHHTATHTAAHATHHADHQACTMSQLSGSPQKYMIMRESIIKPIIDGIVPD